MSSASDPHSILNRNPNSSNFKVPANKPKISRYYAGKAPDFEKQDDSDDDIFPGLNDFKSLGDTSITSEKLNKRLAQIDALSEKPERSIFQTELVKNSEDKLVKNIEKALDKNDKTIVKSEKIIETTAKINEKNVENLDDAQNRSRRAALKAKLLAKESQIAPKTPIERPEVENDFKSESEEISESSESDSEDNKPITSILKPVFIQKEDRDPSEKQIIEEIAIEEEMKKLKERKKIETKILVSEAIKANNEKEDEEAEKSHSEEGMPEDNDTVDIDQELESWKIRELKRLKRDRQERIKRDTEQAEINRRRLLTDEERKAEDMLLGSDATEKTEKTPYRFMQKYYHKGVFFLDLEDPVLKRDYNTAVGEDMFDKSNLPKILWKRRGVFGKKGQSKYTHLTDQDTTNFDPEVRPDEQLRDKMFGKMAGLKAANILERRDLKKMKL